jgi:hypothetical protein
MGAPKGFGPTNNHTTRGPRRYLLAQRVVLPGTLIAGATTLVAPLFYSRFMRPVLMRAFDPHLAAI